jgi:hypothetical protein
MKLLINRGIGVYCKKISPVKLYILVKIFVSKPDFAGLIHKFNTKLLKA